MSQSISCVLLQAERHTSPATRLPWVYCDVPPLPRSLTPPLPPPDSSVHGGGTRGAATVVMSWMFRSTGRHGHTKIDRLSDGTVQFAVSDPPPPAATVAALVLSTSPTQKALFGGVLPLRREHSPVAAMTAAMAATLLGEAVSVDTG